MTKNLAIGADIGGSHISCAAVDIISGKIFEETFSEKAVDNQAQADKIIGTWVEALSDVLSKVPLEKVKGIGFAMPGPFDYINGISYIKGVAKYDNLYGLNIINSIKQKIDSSNDLSIRFINDASAFAVGEAWVGSATGFDRSFSITLGTGIGSAFIKSGIPIVKDSNLPDKGCVYHLPFKDGIADEYFSTRGLLKSYKNITGEELSGVKELAELAISDKQVMDIFIEFGIDLGKFLAPWINGFSAEIIVIGGNISNAFNLFGEYFKESLIKNKCYCKVSISKLKENASILGSAYLFDDNFWKSVQPALSFM
jgi:glucokinase